jgi:DNA-binding NarL/FixJ family response regulator
MSTKMNQNNKKEWRRSKVWELLVKGYNHYEIAIMLQILRPTTTKYIRYLSQQDRGEPPKSYARKIATRI